MLRLAPSMFVLLALGVPGVAWAGDARQGPAPAEPAAEEPPPEEPADVEPASEQAEAAAVDELRAEIDALRKRQAETEAEVEALNQKLEGVESAEKPTSKEKRDKTKPHALGWDKWTSGNAMATRVTFAFGDDNVLAGPVDRSPQAGFAVPDDQLFFEQLEQRRRGFENETQFVVYKRMQSYFKHLDAEAALVIELEHFINKETFRNQTLIQDDGSYLKLNYYIKPYDYDGDNVNLTVFPLDSQRFLLGYTYEITWGGQRIFPNNTGQVPGLRLKYDWNVGTGRDSYVFLGAKTARLLNDEINETQTYYGGLGGFGFAFTDWLMWEVNGGYFQRGAFPPQGVDFPGIGGRTAQSFGGSTRLSFRKGMPVGSSIDFRLFEYAPDASFLLTQPVHYDDKIAWSVAPEFTVIGQTLLRWERPDTTVLTPALAGALTTKVRIKKLRLFSWLIYRDVNFVVFNIPGIAPYRAFPEGASVKPEFFATFGVDYFFKKPRLTPGVYFAYKRPATYNSNDVTTVLRDQDDWETLPPGEGAFDILASKLTVKWEVAPFFFVLGELRYQLDNNRTKFVQANNESGRIRVFDDPNVQNRLGFFLLAQARW